MAMLPALLASGADVLPSPRILFVDDDVGMLTILRMLIARTRPRWEAEFAESGDLALETLKRRPFDVLMTDLEMPRMGGLTLLELVMERHPSVVRVIHSAVSQAIEPRRLAALASAIVHKPADPADLFAVLDRACVAAQQVLPAS